MPAMWGIHNDQKHLDLVGGGFVSVGWDALGDLSDADRSRENLKAMVRDRYPDIKAGAIPVWAGMLYRFTNEMQIGDYVVSPNKDRTINFGVIESDFYSEPDADVHRNRRKVRWLKTEVPRDEFSQAALNEIGSALTLFKVRTNTAEFEPYFSDRGPTSRLTRMDDDEESLELRDDEPNAERTITYTRDFIAKRLGALEPTRFEEFVADLMNAMGYRATATPPSQDGGVDVIASRDPLALEPPIIKVQCKRTVATMGAQAVQQLVGALADGGSELGLFVTLGNFSADAIRIERQRQNLRLVNGAALIEYVFEYYDALDPEWKQEIPLRPVYAVDRSAE